MRIPYHGLISTIGVCVCVCVCVHMQMYVLIYVFWIWTIWSLLNLLQYCFSFIYLFFYYKACRILAPLPGIELVPPALQGKVLTPGISPYVFSLGEDPSHKSYFHSDL